MSNILHRERNFITMNTINNHYSRIVILLTPKLLLTSASLAILGTGIRFVSINAISLLKHSQPMIQSLNLVISILFITSLLCFSLVILLNSIELILRSIHDKATNLFRAYKETYLLQRFTLQPNNPAERNIAVYRITRTFNKAMRKSIVDVRNDYLLVYITLPQQQKAQKYLIDIIEQVEEQQSFNNPDYYFSKPFRENNQLIFKGTRR